MLTSLPFGVTIPQDSRSSVREARPPLDERVLQLLDDHCPWDLLDDTVLAIIDQTYAALLEILGLAAAPPEDGEPVEVTQLVYCATDPNSPATPPVPCVVQLEASARHSRISLTAGLHKINDWCEFSNFICQMTRTRRQRQERRASVRTWPGTIRLARANGGVRVRPDVSGKGFLAVLDILPGVVPAGKGLLGVLDTVRSRLNAAIEAESGMITMVRKNRCRSYDSSVLRDIFTVRTVLEKMRREVDIGAIMRRRTYDRQTRWIGRRRLAVEMDVDQVDEEEEVLAKRLKALHV